MNAAAMAMLMTAGCSDRFAATHCYTKRTCPADGSTSGKSGGGGSVNEADTESGGGSSSNTGGTSDARLGPRRSGHRRDHQLARFY